MSAYQYKCRECGNYFDEPHRYAEHHGFNMGPAEYWSVCPFCDSTDWGDAYQVEREEEAAKGAVECPHCGCYFDSDMFDEDGFAICPYCEKEVE